MANYYTSSCITSAIFTFTGSNEVTVADHDAHDIPGTPPPSPAPADPMQGPVAAKQISSIRVTTLLVGHLAVAKLSSITCISVITLLQWLIFNFSSAIGGYFTNFLNLWRFCQKQLT